MPISLGEDGYLVVISEDCDLLCTRIKSILKSTQNTLSHYIHPYLKSFLLTAILYPFFSGTAAAFTTYCRQRLLHKH